MTVRKNTPVAMNDSTADAQPGSPFVRTEPIQERSAARIDALLDAAANVVDEIGYARLTTAMVAERAHASIGTVYRYFPDRLVLLHALRDRAVQRFRARVLETVQAAELEYVWEAVDLALDAFVDMYRTEPGFGIIRFVDPASAGTVEGEDADVGFFARAFADLVSEEFGIAPGRELTLHVEVVVEILDALVSRAFLVSAAGDERFIQEAQAVIRPYLAQRYGDALSDR